MKIENTSKVNSSKWLNLKSSTYWDKKHNLRRWDFVERVRNPKIVSMIVQSTISDKILLIRQFRVPLNIEVIEFPAGLVDAGESLEDAALRELREETGYTAEIVSVSSPTPKSAGLTTEQSNVVLCKTDETQRGDTSLEDSEDIITFWIHPSEFFKFISSLNKTNKEVLVSNDVYTFFTGHLIAMTK